MQIIIILSVLLKQVISSDNLTVYVNNVSPYSNPIETYRYYMLPFCSPKNLFAGDLTFGQALSGDRKMNSLYNFTVNQNSSQLQVCNKSVDQNDLHQFRDVIRQNYTTEFYIGCIQLHDIIGKLQDGKTLLKKHILFSLYLDKQMKEVYLINISKPVESDFIDISNDLRSIEFVFSTLIILIDSPAQLIEGDYLEQEGQTRIDWSYIIIKCFINLVLVATVCWILRRALKYDFIRLSDEENDWNEVVGWKMVRSEALMAPDTELVLAALLGTGVQFLFLTVIEISLGVLGLYYGHKGTIKTTGIITYAFTGFFNGYYSGKYYKFLGGKKWKLNIMLTLALFPGSMVTTWFVINALAWYMDSTAAIPLQSMFFIAFLWAVIYLPITIIGGISGRLRTIDQMPNVNLKQSKLTKPIPEQKWTNSPIFKLFVSGILPLLQLQIVIKRSVEYEINQIFQSAWGHYNFHLYSMILVSFLQTLMVVACISIVMSYNQLNQQDYSWWWSSFTNSGSIGVVLFLYSVYYYLFISQMHGIIQTSFFFGYSFISALVVSLMFATVGFIASFKFVFYIYGSSKGE